MSPRVLRAIGLTAVPALALSTLAALPSAPAYAAEPDPAPVAAGAAWLEGELTDGVLFNPNFGGFNDYGLSIDLGLGLVEVGGHDTAVDDVSDALAKHIADPGDEFPYVGDGTIESYAGPLGKASVFARAAGDDPTAYGGVNLVDRLEDRVLTDGATAGRIQDLSEFGDFANVIGQSYAVRALDEAGSLLTDSATDFLLAQQCDEGFFRQDFSAIDAADQTCDGQESPAPDTDVTALAVLALQGQADDTDVQAALDAAVTWLLQAQKANGSFGASPLIPTANTNSTGLAGWALGVEGETAAAERAAAWVRGRQADDPAPCTTALAGEAGAIAYDAAAQQAGRVDGITTQTQDQWRRASAQALPALQWAPLTGTGAVQPIDTDGYFRAGTRVTVGADGVAPGDTVCFSRAGAGVALAPAGHNGQALARVLLPQGSGIRTYLSNDGQSEGQPLSFHALGDKRFPLELKKQVVRGEKQVLKVRGLADGEHYKVTYRGNRVAKGRADDDGRITVRFGVGRKLGPAKVKVVGEFPDRRAVSTFRVIR